MNKLLRPVYKYINVHPLKETRRFAGHSKWQSIKHTKEGNDADKAVMTDKHLKEMKAAIAEGGTASPEANMRLAYLMEQGKKKKVPSGTMKAFLERMQTAKVKPYNLWINIQGPDGCFLVFHLVTDNVDRMKHHINSMLKKAMCKLVSEGAESAFEIQGAIITDKFCDIDAATDIGIDIGAEDVSEVEKDGKVYLRFACDPGHLMTVKRNLEKLGHSVISAEDEYIPHSLVEVSDEGLEHIGKLLDRVKATGDLVRMYDNIA